MSTQRAEEILAFIKDFIRTENLSPSVREICEGVGIRSTSTVHRYLHRLEEEGYLHMADGKNRAIVVTDLEDEPEQPGIPLVGTVAAGVPITAVENITDYVVFEPLRNYAGQLFALRVRGESMINAGIFDGDIVIVEQTPYAENGEIVVALVDNEATVKTFFREEGHYRLQPENAAMEPIIVEEVIILGKVLAIQRRYA